MVPTNSATYLGVSMTAQDIYTVAGLVPAGYSGDGGAATSAMLNYPEGSAVDSSGNIFFIEELNNVVRMAVVTSGSLFAGV